MISPELLEQIKNDLRRHEGCVPHVYLDSEGLRTLGIGHLIGNSDPEWFYEVGMPVDPEVVEEYFEEDVAEAVHDASYLVNLEKHPDFVKRVLINMAFNLGRTRLSGFKKMLKCIEDRNYGLAANEMVDSKWYKQVGRRSKELVKIMRGEA